MSHSQAETATPRNRRVRFPGGIAGLSALLTAVGVVIALAAWLYPRAPGTPPDLGTRAGATIDMPTATANGGSAPLAVNTATPSTGAPSTTGAPAATNVPTQPFDYLDALPRQGGSAAAMPRQVSGEPGNEHAIVIACPSNQSSDRTREVTYSLRGRYLDLAAIVRPYFGADRSESAQVFALAVTKERDGTLTRTQ